MRKSQFAFLLLYTSILEVYKSRFKFFGLGSLKDLPEGDDPLLEKNGGNPQCKKIWSWVLYTYNDVIMEYIIYNDIIMYYITYNVFLRNIMVSDAEKTNIRASYYL